MDKWDELTHRVQQSILAQEPEAAAAAGFQLVAEFGRTLDRIATVLEMRELVISGDDLGGIPPELRHEDDEPPVHDL